MLTPNLSLQMSSSSGIDGANTSGASSGGTSASAFEAAAASASLDKYMVPGLLVVLVIGVLAMVRK